MAKYHNWLISLFLFLFGWLWKSTTVNHFPFFCFCANLSMSFFFLWLFWCIGLSRPDITRWPPKSFCQLVRLSLLVNLGSAFMDQAPSKVGSSLKQKTLMHVMSMLPNGLNILIGKSHPFWPMNRLVPWLRKHTADYRLTAQCFTWFKWSIVFFLCLAWLFYVDFSFAILSSWFLLPRGIIELASPSNIDICWRVANFYDSLTCDICICWLDISVLILSFFYWCCGYVDCSVITWMKSDASIDKIFTPVLTAALFGL